MITIRLRFMFVIWFFGGLVGSKQVVIAQEPPPPPPPLIYKAPDKSLLKNYIFEDKTFEVVFPGDPSIKNIDANDFKVISLETYKDGSHSKVVVYKYNVVMDKDRTALYERIRQNILNTPKTKIESEIDVKNGLIDGHEFNILSDLDYKRLRVFVKEKTVYLISCDVTNWHILTTLYTKQDKVAEFKTESERFMNSFKINK